VRIPSTSNDRGSSLFKVQSSRFKRETKKEISEGVGWARIEGRGWRMVNPGIDPLPSILDSRPVLFLALKRE
jgi:hypothetical protein